MVSNVLHTVAGLHRRGGGTSVAVSSLCTALVQNGVDVELLTGGNEKQKRDWILPDEQQVTIHSAAHRNFIGARLLDCSSYRALVTRRHNSKAFQIIHDHGIWLLSNHLSANVAGRLGLPFVSSIHGMLEPWAWQHRGWKKRLAWWGWVKKDLSLAAVIHVTSEQEAESIRGLGLSNPLTIIPCGVELPAMNEKKLKDGETKTLLFLSRLHPKKGILNLVKAWDRLRPDGWRVVLAGPDEGGHELEVRDYLARTNLTNQFEFTGPLYGKDKWKLLRGAELFVLPSHSENFGIVIAEAMAAGLPVITTQMTPWNELVTHKCGWWIEAGIEPLVQALKEGIELSFEQRVEMGQRGRALVAEKYGWQQIGRKMLATYNWILGQGTKPVHVQLN